MTPLRVGLAVVAVLALVAIGVAASQLPAIGAGALLYPTRRINTQTMPAGCVERKFDGVEVVLDAWQCRSTAAERRDTIVYLHGIADNRGSAAGAIARLLPLGFDVVAFDSRAHGGSGGERCTYGYFEKRDLQKVIDQLGVGSVILIGHSLGAAVALQTAAIDPRVRATVAASTFSDLRTVASERVPFLPAWSLGPAFARAEQDAHFVVDEVSPLRAAANIRVPVLLIHGADDRETRPVHSSRVLAALAGPKELVTVANAGHNDALRADVWPRIETWLSALDASTAPPTK
jgi:pimeloyl-ACP methyl ester carboxylesterase